MYVIVVHILLGVLAKNSEILETSRILECRLFRTNYSGAVFDLGQKAIIPGSVDYNTMACGSMLNL